MNIKAFVFDLDGTLLNTLADLTDSVNFALKDQGFPVHTAEEIRSYIGNGVAKLIERAIPKGTSPQAIALTLDSFRSHYRENCINSTKSYPDVDYMLKTLHQLGFKIGVFSNKSHYETVKLVNAFFGQNVDCTRGSVKGFPRKPAADGLFWVLEQLGISPEHSVYVGDSDVDVATAVNAGIPSIGVTWGFRGRDVLLRAGANMIIDSPCQLIDIAGQNKKPNPQRIRQ